MIVDVDGALPAVVYVDATAATPVARMLRDQVGAIARQSPAPMPVPRKIVPSASTRSAGFVTLPSPGQCVALADSVARCAGAREPAVWRCQPVGPVSKGEWK
mgnify:CR=1 FL=1